MLSKLNAPLIYIYIYILYYLFIETVMRTFKLYFYNKLNEYNDMRMNSIIICSIYCTAL